MNLFFETGSQAFSFLSMVPVGFAAAFCMEIGRFHTSIRALTDVFVMLAAGFVVLVIIVFCRENTLRLYHLLGLLTGTVIYMQGVGKIIRHLAARQDLKRRAAK